MKKYLKLKTPEGLKLHSHFFIQDKGKPDTRYEMYLFTVIDSDGFCELPNGWKAKTGDIIHAQAHTQDNYNDVSWNINAGSFFRWFNRCIIKDQDYDLLTAEEGMPEIREEEKNEQ